MSPTSSNSNNNKRESSFYIEVLLPILISVLICAVLFTLSFFAAQKVGGDFSKLADVAIILMSAPIFLLFLVGIFVCIFVIKLLFGSDRGLLEILLKSQRIFDQASIKIRAVLNLSTQPVIKGNSAIAGLKSFIKTITRAGHEMEEK